MSLRWHVLVACVCLACAAALPLQAQPSQDTASVAPESPASTWVVLPFLYSTPETGLAGGLVVGRYGSASPRPSSVETSVTWTARRQVVLDVRPDLRLRQGTLWMRGEGRAKRYPDVFYGIGHETTPEMEEDYTSRAVEASLQVQRLAGDLWLGPRVEFRRDRVVEKEQGGLLDAGDVPGADGVTALGLGVALTRDTRDHVYQPHRGTLADLRWSAFHASGGHSGSFGLLLLDVRRYGLAGPGVLATRVYAQAVQGEAPFTLLPKVGGSRLLRGYREGRFRDDLLGALEAEYRVPLFWRLGAVVFASVGDVASDFGDLPAWRELERSFGAGLRFRVNDAGVRIRVDWARGREETGFYLSLGEAF